MSDLPIGDVTIDQNARQASAFNKVDRGSSCFNDQSSLVTGLAHRILGDRRAEHLKFLFG